ncbi:MAG: Rieske 2Fe-2S domain-containing protein [Acidobacteriaceae bacterium]|nr:Rieske 2Fe-2S domain-containing protein [Acidobacteriaceae bacterium]
MSPIRAADHTSPLVEITSAAKPGPPADMIFGEWYPALRSAPIKRGKTALTTLLGIPMLVGRKNDGTLFALRDLCPHRGIPLSAGWFDGETVQCKYHGWRFEPCTGRCEEIPSLTSHDALEPSKIFANSFPIVEQDGYAWVYVPEAGAGRLTAESSLPPIPELPKFSSRYRSAHITADLPCNVDHGIIGLMDPAHGPFVHRAWWWRSAASIHEKTKLYEPLEDLENGGRNAGFRMSPHTPSSNSAPYKLIGKPTTTIDFVLPNRRYETIKAEKNGKVRWFTSLTTVTPVTASTCRIDVLAAWDIAYHLPFVKPIALHFGKRFVQQDQQTMVEQARGLRSNPALMLIDDADKPAKWYFALKQRRLKGTGEHPLPGPVELHWRS